MKNITKEQIDEIVTKAGLKVCEKSCDILSENLDNFIKIGKESDEDVFKKYPHYFALMTSTYQMSINTIKLSLYELLCDE